MKIACTRSPEDLQKLDRVEFHKIWFIDALTDRQMAKMFGVTTKEVKAKRKELGLNWFNSAVLYITGGSKYKGGNVK